MSILALKLEDFGLLQKAVTHPCDAAVGYLQH
ncbi:hypothetical protein SY89_03171 [Halolamina pelagica]|uniref:Uncharacterized protein n=1 Tax=Halolamina pelagica TaxID=699431 RepID=A0A0P7G6X6_9EURY|nr:hypothetical protein SY89_03171 [Halolamina pelagica]